jgi:hypothetical protein
MKRIPEASILLLIGDSSGRQFIGCRAIPGRLPALSRLPGEGPAMFAARCRAHLTLGPAVVGQLVYTVEGTTSKKWVPPGT